MKLLSIYMVKSNKDESFGAPWRLNKSSRRYYLRIRSVLCIWSKKEIATGFMWSLNPIIAETVFCHFLSLPQRKEFPNNYEDIVWTRTREAFEIIRSIFNWQRRVLSKFKWLAFLHSSSSKSRSLSVTF